MQPIPPRLLRTGAETQTEPPISSLAPMVSFTNRDLFEPHWHLSTRWGARMSLRQRIHRIRIKPKRMERRTTILHRLHHQTLPTRHPHRLPTLIPHQIKQTDTNNIKANNMQLASIIIVMVSIRSQSNRKRMVPSTGD